MEYLIYNPSTFSITSTLGNQVTVMEGNIIVNSKIIHNIFGTLRPDYSMDSLNGLIVCLERHFKGNVEIPMTAVGRAWLDVLVYHKEYNTLHKNVQLGINKNGYYVKINTVKEPEKYYIWSDARLTFVVPTEVQQEIISNDGSVTYV